MTSLRKAKKKYKAGVIRDYRNVMPWRKVRKIRVQRYIGYLWLLNKRRSFRVAYVRFGCREARLCKEYYEERQRRINEMVAAEYGKPMFLDTKMFSLEPL